MTAVPQKTPPFARSSPHVAPAAPSATSVATGATGAPRKAYGARHRPLPIRVPERLVELMRRCLRKDPFRRFQHVDDVKVELEELKEAGGRADTRLPHTSTKLWRIAIPENGSATPRPNRMLWTGGGLSVLVLLAVGTWLWAAADRHLPVVRPMKSTLLGSVAQPAFSPDGKEIAYTWSGEDGASQSIYVKLIGSETHLRLTTPLGATQLQPGHRMGDSLRFTANYREPRDITSSRHWVELCARYSAQTLTMTWLAPAWRWRLAGISGQRRT
jgi:hypothetical protein